MPQELDDPDLPLETIFRRWPPTAAVFVEHGMLCVGCPVSTFHTVADACFEYGLNEKTFRAELRAVISTASNRLPDR